jgi:peptidoglycan hydrolase-like protein with peptidoglycan-binding domain
MALQSQLFRGDQELEAAAASDPAHIALGARGAHVGKLQQALVQLDGAGIDIDSKYGPATAAAVLAYKRRRNIINATYQREADNIVGKMTMASLDREMLAKETADSNQVTYVPAVLWRPLPPRRRVT